jgi:hypothetical protein
MPKVDPYHSTSSEDEDVYHDHNDCPDGERILPEDWAPGTGGRQRCQSCKDLD